MLSRTSLVKQQEQKGKIKLYWSWSLEVSYCNTIESITAYTGPVVATVHNLILAKFKLIKNYTKIRHR